MVFGGIQKTSLLDYPSKICCVLFAQGCNFRCPYCHNPRLVGTGPPQQSIFEQEVFAFLSKRKIWIDGVVITGGEPTLQDNLFDFCGRLKNMGFSVKIDTNGSRPQMVEKLIGSGHVDYVAMDIKTDPKRYAPVISETVDPDHIRESARCILASGIDHEFRTTCIKSIVDSDAVRAIGKIIKGARRYVLQQVQYNGVQVLNPQYFKVSGRHMDAADISALRDIGAGFAETCMIRWAPGHDGPAGAWDRIPAGNIGIGGRPKTAGR